MQTDHDVSKPLKTWSHLAANRRRPTEYEIVSTNLLWTDWGDKPFAMGRTLPLSQWMVTNRNRSPLVHADWDAFRDPDQMIYRTYNTIQDGQEAYVDGLLLDHRKNDHDSALPQAWVRSLGRFYTPARYLMHAVQMSSNYLVTVAPASTVMNCFIFQAGDSLRWLSRIAYRTAELRAAFPDAGFATGERAMWERDAAWQGFRELVERSLTSYDWAEQFVALNLVVKPAIDAAFLGGLAQAGRANHDSLTGVLCDAQLIDSERCRRWTAALLKFSEQTDGNRAVIERWLAKWIPIGDAAIAAYCDALDDSGATTATAQKSAANLRVLMGA